MTTRSPKTDLTEIFSDESDTQTNISHGSANRGKTTSHRIADSDLFLSIESDNNKTNDNVEYRTRLGAAGITPEEISILEDVLNSPVNKVSGGEIKGVETYLYTYYEDVLLLMLKRHENTYPEIVDVFRESPYCRERGISGLGKRYKKLALKLGGLLYGDWDEILPVVAENNSSEWPDYPKTISKASSEVKTITPPKDFNNIHTSDWGRLGQAGSNILNHIANNTSHRFNTMPTNVYNDYELALLYICDKNKWNCDEIAAYFNATPVLCSPRNAKDIQNEILNCDKEEWKKSKIIIKTALREQYNEQIAALDKEETAASENKETINPKKEYHSGYIRNVDYGEEQTSSDATLASSAKNSFPLGSIMNDRMGMTDKLTKIKYVQDKKYYQTVQSLFSLLKRNNGAKMNRAVRVQELAYYWNCREQEAIERIDAFIARGVSITRDGDLIREISHVDNMRGGIALFDIKANSVDLGNGASVVRLGVASDTHYGSPMCEEELIERFYEIAYDAGVRVFMHAGDLFDGEGVYKGHDFEVTRKGFDKNLMHVAEIYPKFEDTTTYAIVGNHDHSYISRTGVNPIFHLSTLRDDIKYCGIYQANIRINNEFLVNLHHGAAGCSRVAPEAYLRRIINDKQEFLQHVGMTKYDLCVLGHYHIDAMVETPFCRKGIFGGGWQNTTAFTRRLNLPPYIGGYIVNMYKLPSGEHHIAVEKIEFGVDAKIA